MSIEKAKEYEANRIKALREERERIQKKTFTKWMNSFLQKSKMEKLEVEDLFTDLSDGKKLLRLLEIISGEKLGKVNTSRHRIHKIENVNKSLAFLHTKVKLESIGSEDIVDGKPQLILGLIWTIILRFQIQPIRIPDADDENSEKKSARDALLLWCQSKTKEYPTVNITDFSNSWRNGLAFNALIHAHCPELLDFYRLDPNDHFHNLNHAFEVAQNELSIPQLLDAEDLVRNKEIDEKCVLTYVASYYHCLTKRRQKEMEGRRIANIIRQLMRTDAKKMEYEQAASRLLAWIQAKVTELRRLEFPNSLEGIQGELLRFKEYRTVKKPPKYRERSDVEELLFLVQTQVKALGQPLYVPPEGVHVHDIERAWAELEKAEHQRELALRKELLHQEYLENLAYKFLKKCMVREGYLKEMTQVLADPSYGSNLGQVEATIKKHEALSADIHLNWKERFKIISDMAEELIQKNYHGKEDIKEREQHILLKWQQLLDWLEKHRQTLSQLGRMMALIRELETLSGELTQLEAATASPDLGKHVQAVEDLLEGHTLLEAQISSHGDAITRLNTHQDLVTGEHAELFQRKLQRLNQDYQNLVEMAAKRRGELLLSRTYLQFVQDQEEAEAWVVERQRICRADVPSRGDLPAAQSKHLALEQEIQGHWPLIERVLHRGEELPQSLGVKPRISSLRQSWELLQDLWKQKCRQLEEACLAFQYHTDANEMESWLREKHQLVSSTDYGQDELGAQALLRLHSHLEDQIAAYSADVDRLNTQASSLVQAGSTFLKLLEEQPETTAAMEEEWSEEMVTVPVEEWVEVVVEKEVVKEFVEEKRVPQVQALYNFTGQGLEVKKGEVMILLQKTNSDWWNIRKATGQDGFVPANYVKTIESRIVRKPVKKTVKVPEKQRVKSIVMKRQIVRKKKEKSPAKKSRAASLRKDIDVVELRQKNINNEYETLKHLARVRHQKLEEAKKLFSFYTECEDFENWMKEKERLLKTEDPKESVVVKKKKFENFLTELSASRQRVEDIDTLVDNFNKSGSTKLDTIKSHQRQIHQRWNKLNGLKQEKERSLQGATSVELFHRTCDEALEWMQEKLDKICVDEIGRDLQTVQALQRKHENVVRELAPVEDKFNRVNLLADSVKASYPSEKETVAARQRELQSLWNQVKAKTAERRTRLDESRGLQIFKNSAKALLSWVVTVKQALNSDEPARDVATAENLLKKHQDLVDDITSHEAEFDAVTGLGHTLAAKKLPGSEVELGLTQMDQERAAIHRGCQEKGDWLRQNLDLQLFSREADQIDSLTNSHLVFLEFNSLGSTLDEVEALLKRHDNFTNTLIAQEERLRLFSEMADKLIAAHHYDSPQIDEKRHQVLARRKVVQEKAQQRRKELLSAHAYQYFLAEVHEFVSWIQDKLKVASDESYRELINLEAKLKKHEAFEAEVKANQDRLHVIKTNGQLLESEHGQKVRTIVEQPAELWETLCHHTEEKGRKLRQAVAQLTLNRSLVDARTKLEELEVALTSEDSGSDLRTVKQMLKKHQAMETELVTWDHKLQDLNQQGELMAKQGHFDAPNILKAIKAVSTRCRNLYEPCKQRRQKLQESLALQEFTAELAVEQQWVQEHLSLASSQELGQNLVELQSLCKKHQKLRREVEGHQAQVSKTLATAVEYGLTALREELDQSWQQLQKLVADRQARLDLALKAQLFFNEALEIENWMNEKMDVLTSTDYGRDEDAAIKMLTKHKALELEIDTYSGLITEITHQAQKMIDSDHPDSKVISNRMQVIQQQIKNMNKLANIKRGKLLEAKLKLEYFRESGELEDWITEQLQTAMSEDYGQDFEHLLYLHSKFDDFKHRVQAGMERFNQCEELAKKQVENESPFSEDIEKQQNHLSECWNNLLDHIDAREQKLKAAGEIHRFNRDVADALIRIHEKYTSISSDLGRDLNSVYHLIRKHEGFVNDLVALEGQLQVVLDDSARLQQAYPGGNAEHIQEQQDMVVANWNVLQERTAQRREELQGSLVFHKLLATVRALEGWAQGVVCGLRAEEKVRDLGRAQSLKAEHEQLKAEIEAREPEFQAVVAAGEEMAGHPAIAEVRDRVGQLLATRDELLGAWQLKKVQLDQLCDLHFFLRDSKQLDTLSSQQELYLSGHIDQASTVEEVDSLVKKHDAFEKLLVTQEEKLTSLQEHGIKLLQQNHFESELIRRRLDEVIARRTRIRELSSLRRHKLADALLYSQFIRDSTEASAWLREKQKKLEAADQATSSADPATLEEKMKKLQKHQAFQSELSAHASSINAIKQKGEQLLSKQHEASTDVRLRLDSLLSQWANLLGAAAERGRGLEEAQDMLEFNLSADRMEAWIRDKELMIQAGERGEDYEHCLALQRKLDDVDSDMRLDESYVKNINLLAGKLIRQGRSDGRAVQVRKEELNNKWKALQGALEEYRAKLGGALVVHSFNRDVDDTSERINEKAIMLSVEDEGKSLQAVEALQSRHEAIERDMTAIEAKIKEHEAGVRTLVQRYPDQANHIRTKVSDLQDQWRKLRTLSQTRKHKLAISYTLHKFLEDLKKMENWVSSMVERMQSGELGSNMAEARDQLQLHEERKAEINGRQEAFRSLHDFGQGLRHQLAAGPAELVAQSLERLEQLRRSLAQTWEERHSTLSQCYQLQVFKDLADQTESWLASKEAFFNNDDLGDSMSSVEVLLRNHTNFERTMLAQDGLVAQVEQRAAELANHYDAESIHARTTALCQRRDRLKEAAKARRDKLLQSKALHTFLQHHYEVESWMQEKLQVACDENYRDPTNLVSKIQKHAVFEAELVASQGRVDALAGEGEQLLNTGNYASDVIQARLEQLATQWQECQDKTLMKKERLHGAYQALQFTRLLEDLDAWMDDIENQLQSEDHGRDLTSVQGLLKKHLLLELDINNHSEKMEMVKDQVANFQHHFLHEEVEERANQVLKRYKGLYEPAQIRRENLEDALLLHQFLHDAEDERHWLSDKTVLASSSELGDNLTAVQSLIKKHEVLEAEIEGHAPLIETVVGKGKQLVRSGHFASAEVEAALTGLQNQLSQLRDLASVRRLRLSDSLQSQIFYTELAETEAWLRERLPQLTSQDLGKDEASVQALEKKLEVLERDVDNYQHTVGKTLNLGASLVERGHFDATNISSRMAELEELYQGLQALVAQRHEALSKSRRLFTFLRDADEVAAWFRDRLPIANSDDFGKDVEHVEILIQRFEDFMSTLSAGEVRLEAVQSAARSLAQESHPEARLALNRAAEAARLRAELKDAATARMEALHGAKQVHTFDRSADETISWIDEKDLVVRSEDYGHDLPSIQTLIRLHQAFESELAAVKVQVEALSEEAKRLASKFPAAAEHIEAKQEEVTEAWNQLLDRAAARKSRLCQAEQLQAYFDEYRELMAWINEMTAVITSDELAPDVSGSQTLLYRHKQRRAEIETRKEATAQFQATGEAIISGGHFMASEIRDKLDRLNRAFDNLTDLWNDHLSLYEQYLDAQIFRKDAEQLEAWLQTRSTMVRQDDLGDSIEAVEELLHSHEDFMKTLEAQEDKLQALTRITKIEEAFQWRKNEEERRRKQEVERLEKERMNAVRRNEQNRILEERRTEDDLRADNLPQFKRGESLMLSPAKVSQIGLKRSESAKLDKRLPKRTPSFNTRHPRQPVPSALPPVEIEGFLERKQELQNGGKRATVRSWKTYYTVLCGQLLCFFKDKATFIEKQALAPPVSLRHAICAKATDYTKRKHVIRVQLSDGAKFLFAGPDAETMQDWLEKLSFHADLSPSNQLLSYDSHKNLSPRPEPPSYEETLQMRSKPPLPPRNPTQPPPVPARNSFPPEGPSQQQNGFSSPTQPPLPEPRVPAPSMMEDSEEDWSSSVYERRPSRTNSESSDYSSFHRQSYHGGETPPPSLVGFQPVSTMAAHSHPAGGSTSSLSTDTTVDKQGSKRRKFNLFRKR